MKNERVVLSELSMRLADGPDVVRPDSVDGTERRAGVGSDLPVPGSESRPRLHARLMRGLRDRSSGGTSGGENQCDKGADNRDRDERHIDDATPTGMSPSFVGGLRRRVETAKFVISVDLPHGVHIAKA
jgi:hypothetical protein